MRVQQLLQQLTEATNSLSATRNKLAELGASRDNLDPIDRVIGNCRALLRGDSETGNLQ